MKAAVIADLHGNYTAVQALEKDLKRRGIQRIWCLGDVVGKGPSNDRSFDWAVANCEFILRGNWDEGVGLKAFANDAFYYAQLGEERLAALLRFPLEKQLILSGRRIRLIHGRPVTKRLLPLHGPAESLQDLLSDGFDVLGYADTHTQGLRMMQGKMLFNCGAVGNALSLNMIQYAILEGEEAQEIAPLDISFVTLPYNIKEAVQEALAQPDLPKGSMYIQELETGKYAGDRGFRGK